MSKWKFAMALGLIALAATTLAAGLYFHHYFIVFVFSLWMAAELLMWRYSAGWRGLSHVARTRFHSLSSVLWLHGRFDTISERVVEEKILELTRSGTITELETRWLGRLKDLVALRHLILSQPERGKTGIKQAFTLRKPVPKEIRLTLIGDNVSIQDITESATLVADLYWKLFDTALGGYAELTIRARELYEQIFGVPFDLETSRHTIERLTDSMQRDRGIPFLILNLIQSGNWKTGRALAQRLLTEEIEVDEDVSSTLYWLSEIYWFTEEGPEVLENFESTIRYLYHLCFTNPERAGFLEIDSQFFSQFETVSELAQEAFLFRETLIEKILEVWKTQDGMFDGLFQRVLETMTQRPSKIYDERANWEMFWKREKEGFDRDYLFVVEGNLSYAKGHYEDALFCYEKALKISPRSRAALLNSAFCYARLGNTDKHHMTVERIVLDKDLHPTSIFVAGDSYLLIGNEKKAEVYYSLLARMEGWPRKVDYYKSTFCYENGLFNLALKFAEKAHQLNPHDTSMSYHLSLCYNALGHKDNALEMLKKMPETPEWLNYYRFTLERDAGRHHEASHTLLQIPHDYFQDDEELQEALEFARHRQDLVLLRHLRRREEKQ